MSAEYVYRMEDLLDLYATPADPAAPIVCLDEKPVTLHEDLWEGTPPTPGSQGHPARPERRDYAYARRGAANLFVLVAPQQGWRQVTVTDHRATPDYAEQLRYLAEEAFPDAPRIRLVQDNVSTHTLAALYATFPPERARQLARRFEVHPTPKHASWLNMAEIEISVVSRGCLSRRVPTTQELAERTAALTAERNAAHATIDWRFSVLDARTKLHKLYPEPLTPQNNLD
jgi:hypothetical protein